MDRAILPLIDEATVRLLHGDGDVVRRIYMDMERLHPDRCWYRAEVHNLGFSEAAVTTPMFVRVR